MRLIHLLMLFIATVTLAACGSSATPPPPTPAASPTLPATSTPTPALLPASIDTPNAGASPTLELTAYPSGTMTLTPCAWTWAYGVIPFEATLALEQALAAADIAGTVTLRSFGENGGPDCSYHEMSVGAEAVIYVRDTADLPALALVATQTEDILQGLALDHQPSLANGDSSLTFKGVTGSGQPPCRWDFAAQQCQSDNGP